MRVYYFFELNSGLIMILKGKLAYDQPVKLAGLQSCWLTIMLAYSHTYSHGWPTVKLAYSHDLQSWLAHSQAGLQS